MAELTWDAVGKRFYELGSRKAVLYVQNKDGTYKPGVAWNGLISVNERREGGDQNKIYADDLPYASITTFEKFTGTITAFSYPNDFGLCDGSFSIIPGLSISSQKRSGFALCYRTTIGSDTKGTSEGYKLHLIYNARCSPTEKKYVTKNNESEIIKFSWDFTTIKNSYKIRGEDRSFAYIIIDSRRANRNGLSRLEECLYGNSEQTSRIPSPEEVYAFLSDEGPWAADEENGVLYIWQSLSSSDLPNGELYIE